MSALNPLPPSSSSLKARDFQRMTEAYAKAEKVSADKPSCTKRIWVGLFFDGTNNNMERDRPEKGHSNVVRLFDAFPDRPNDGYFRNYIPGLGTKFPEIGEKTETSSGKAYGKGGAARIHWGLIQVLNSAHRAAELGFLIPDNEAKSAINDAYMLKDAWSVFGNKRQAWFRGKVAQLKANTQNRKPTITHIDVSVFGFSRGAAEARAFCNWLIECCEQDSGGLLSLAGMPLSISFLGLFDTVASVGLADSFPLPVSGHMDWADGTMRIPQQVARCVHLVAAHEIRASFPLNCGRDGASYPSGVLEVVYPGAHSNLGGGYAPGEQGRSRQGVPSLLSQIPLRQMYNEARNAGVPLQALEKIPEATSKDFEISETLRADFSAYLKQTAVSAARVEHMLEGHMRYYRRYKSVTADWETLSMKAAGEQDRQDLKEANKDWDGEVNALRSKKKLAGLKDPRIRVQLTERDEQLLADLNTPVHTDVVKFLDDYVHDSHAGFYLAGPVTKYDKEQETKRVEQLVKSGEKLNAWERKVWTAKQQGKPFPVMTDADQWDMLQGTDMVVAATTGTRREGTGYFRRRAVLDKS